MSPDNLGLFDTPPGRNEIRLGLAIGFEPHETEHIFDAFFTTKATGTGLGLPLCRTIVEDHGGRLWASLGEPHGATFHLRLPQSGAAAIAVEETDQLLTNRRLH